VRPAGKRDGNMQDEQKRTIVYPGRFDPVTMGHVSLVNRALAIFDRVVVSVVANPQKPTTFSLAERMDMAREVFEGDPRVSVKGFDGLLVDYAHKQNADAMLRGLRAVSDFDCEFKMALMNRSQDRQLETLFLMTDSKWLYISSSGVKELARLRGDIHGVVPECVAERLRRKFHPEDFEQPVLRSACA